MKSKKLGSQGLTASAIGLGCMGMSDFYGKRDDENSLKTLHRAHDLGVRFWDTADMYGPFHNEELIGKALKGIRNDITLATKFGIVRYPDNPSARGVNGRPEYVRSACEASLKRLQVDTIDLYYQHRVDPDTPIEETVGAMAQLVTEGKVRAIGLSEASPQTLGIAFVAYSPLGRGFLTGQLKSFDDLAEDDWRRFSPRFQGENFQKNLELVRKIQDLATEKGCTPSQLALAWVMAQGDHIFPIPGTKQIKYLEENVGSLKVALSKEDLKAIDAIAPRNVAAGDRYPEASMKAVNR
jgi:aryl-alcohol dehydrogenase-like predicted oxidoreductase